MIRRHLLTAFGVAAALALGACGGEPEQKAAGAPKETELARKLLSAVYRTGQAFGLGHIEKVLTGAADERISARGHDQLSVYGIVGPDEAPLLRPLARALQARGTLISTEHGGLALGGDARAVLKGDKAVAIALPPQRKEKRGKRGASAGSNPAGDPLFDALRALRRELAQQAGVPPYVIFHDATLREMAQLRPATLSALGEVSGVGARKLEAYGDAFLTVIRAH